MTFSLVSILICPNYMRFFIVVFFNLLIFSPLNFLEKFSILLIKSIFLLVLAPSDLFNY